MTGGERRMHEKFRKFSAAISHAAGSSWAFVAALWLIVMWLLTGPFFGFSDTWQLIINTGTTIVTFLIVFLIQNSQNRDTEAIQLKLDEIIRAISGARTELVDLEELSDEDLNRLKKQFEDLAAAESAKSKDGSGGGQSEEAPGA